MARRWGLGPVFVYEWLTSSRRWQMYAVRSLFVALLLGAMTVAWVNRPYALNLSRLQQLAALGEYLFYAIIGTQLALVLLAAPAATAGSICLDKARGALQHLLITDLSDAEIVLGKLAARLVPVLGLLACALPVLALGVLLGGIDPGALLSAFLVTLAVAVLGSALALTLSVWGTKTHEVLLATYAVWVVALLVYPVWGFIAWGYKLAAPPLWAKWMNPFLLALAPYLYPDATAWEEPLTFLGICLALAAGLTLLAVARIRAVTVHQAGRSEGKRGQERPPGRLQRWRRWLPGPSLDRNPVLWREWHRQRPSRWVRIVWCLYAAGATAASLSVIFQSRNVAGAMGALVNALQVSIGLLLLSVSAVTVLAEERVRGSLDVLLATPLSTVSIVWGKWWGAYRRAPLLAVLPALITWQAARQSGRYAGVWLMVGLILAYAAGITSLGLALATWVSRFSRAVGLSVAAYVLVTVGWIFVVMALMSHGPKAEGAMSASPFFGPGQLTAETVHEFASPRRLEIYAWDTGWIVAYLIVAGLLGLATLVTFNRCLGRMNEGSQGPSRVPPDSTLPEVVWTSVVAAFRGNADGPPVDTPSSSG